MFNNVEFEENKMTLNPNKPKPFLSEIMSGIKFNSMKTQNNENELQTKEMTFEKSNVLNDKKSSSNVLVLNQEQLLKARNTLKKVELCKKDTDDKCAESDDNDSNVKAVYIDQKNNLRKVNTEEKSLLNHLKKHKSKKKKSSKKKTRK